MCDSIPHIVTQGTDGLFPVFGFKIHKPLELGVSFCKC